MSRYRLWLDSYIEVERYYEYLNKKKEERESPTVKENYKMCKALSFMIDDEVKNSFTLEEIDLITAKYFDEDDFLLPIIEDIFAQNKKGKIKLGRPLATYKVNGTLKTQDLIYDSPLLLEYAKKEHSKRKKKTKNAENERLEDTDALQNFCVQLLSIMEEKNDRQYILKPDDTTLNYRTREKIKHLLPKRMITNSPFAPITLYEALKNYAFAFDARGEKQSQGSATAQDDEILTHNQLAVYSVIRRDYRTLRNAILLSKIVENVKQKEQSEEVDSYQQLTLPISNPYQSKEYQDYLKTADENADILRLLAEENRKGQEEHFYYEEEPIITDYSFEETEHYVTPSREKGLRKHG